MVIGSLEIEGTTLRFGKPHLLSLRRLDEATKAVQGGDKSMPALKASEEAVIMLVLDAVKRVDPAATRETIEAVADEDSILELYRSVLSLCGMKAEPAAGEAVSA